MSKPAWKDGRFNNYKCHPTIGKRESVTIRLGGGTPPVRFVVFATHSSWRRAIIRAIPDLRRGAQAICFGTAASPKAKRSSAIEIWLSRENFSFGLLSHEILHALCTMARDAGRKDILDGDAEESAAELLQLYVDTFSHWYVNKAGGALK